VSQIRYPTLIANTYELELRARIGAGPWGPVKHLGFTVRPAWWQSRWFLAVAGLGLLGVLGGVFHLRQRALLSRQTRRLHEQSTAELLALLEALPDLITVHRDGKMTYVNDAARRIWCRSPSEIPDIAGRTHPDDQARRNAAYTRVQSAGGECSETVELRIRDRDDVYRVFEATYSRLKLAGAPVLVVSGRDVTERKRMREQLLLSDRMASLGTLAAGIAHEINNPLSYVIGNLEIIGEGLTPADRDAELTTAVRDAADGAERVRKIVAGLRTFSRSEEEQRVPLQIGDVLQAAIRLTANEVRHRAQLVCELGATPRVVADSARLAQVFINLIVNAAHAIPEGKSGANRITLRTSTDEQGRAVVAVIDTGRGMSPEVLARAFDPFFTTKDVGTGTGLGLPICHGIISALGGEIGIDSAPGQGTTVWVRLRAAPELVERVDEQAVPEPGASERLRVMIVDDDPMVADLIARRLRSDHEVIVVSCGSDALAQIQQGVWFDAIISDVMMPNMTGIELLEQLVEVAPRQAERVIFLSGGVFAPESRARLDALRALLLEKPVDMKVLRAAIATVAASPDEAPSVAVLRNLA
jgi:PAS domain S-box-containing protein